MVEDDGFVSEDGVAAAVDFKELSDDDSAITRGTASINVQSPSTNSLLEEARGWKLNWLEAGGSIERRSRLEARGSRQLPSAFSLEPSAVPSEP